MPNAEPIGEAHSSKYTAMWNATAMMIMVHVCMWVQEHKLLPVNLHVHLQMAETA